MLRIVVYTKDMPNNKRFNLMSIKLLIFRETNQNRAFSISQKNSSQFVKTVEIYFY